MFQSRKRCEICSKANRDIKIFIWFKTFCHCNSIKQVSCACVIDFLLCINISVITMTRTRCFLILISLLIQISSVISLIQYEKKIITRFSLAKVVTSSENIDTLLNTRWTSKRITRLKASLSRQSSISLYDLLRSAAVSNDFKAQSTIDCWKKKISLCSSTIERDLTKTTQSTKTAQWTKSSTIDENSSIDEKSNKVDENSTIDENNTIDENGNIIYESCYFQICEKKSENSCYYSCEKENCICRAKSVLKNHYICSKDYYKSRKH